MAQLRAAYNINPAITTTTDTLKNYSNLNLQNDINSLGAIFKANPQIKNNFDMSGSNAMQQLQQLQDFQNQQQNLVKQQQQHQQSQLNGQQQLSQQHPQNQQQQILNTNSQMLNQQLPNSQQQVQQSKKESPKISQSTVSLPVTVNIPAAVTPEKSKNKETQSPKQRKNIGQPVKINPSPKAEEKKTHSSSSKETKTPKTKPETSQKSKFKLLKEKPLVVLLDGNNCKIEMQNLKDIAKIAFCNADHVSQIHEKVLSDAFCLIIHQTITLSKKALKKFISCKLIVKIGSEVDNVDIKAAADLGIAVYCLPEFQESDELKYDVSENVANMTLELILSLYRKTYHLHHESISRAQQIKDHTKSNSNRLAITKSIEEVDTLCKNSRTMRGKVLGIIGLGNIGSLVALRAVVFGFKIIAYDPNIDYRMSQLLKVEMINSLEVSRKLLGLLKFTK